MKKSRSLLIKTTKDTRPQPQPKESLAWPTAPNRNYCCPLVAFTFSDSKSRCFAEKGPSSRSGNGLEVEATTQPPLHQYVGTITISGVIKGCHLCGHPFLSTPLTCQLGRATGRVSSGKERVGCAVGYQLCQLFSTQKRHFKK